MLKCLLLVEVVLLVVLYDLVKADVKITYLDSWTSRLIYIFKVLK